MRWDDETLAEMRERSFDDIEALERSDRRSEFAPATAGPPLVRAFHVPGPVASPSGGGRRPARSYRGDELAAQMALRPHTGNVLPHGPYSATFVPVDLQWESYKNATSAADTAEAA